MFPLLPPSSAFYENSQDEYPADGPHNVSSRTMTARTVTMSQPPPAAPPPRPEPRRPPEASQGDTAPVVDDEQPTPVCYACRILARRVVDDGPATAAAPPLRAVAAPRPRRRRGAGPRDRARIRPGSRRMGRQPHHHARRRALLDARGRPHEAHVLLIPSSPPRVLRHSFLTSPPPRERLIISRSKGRLLDTVVEVEGVAGRPEPDL